MSKDNDNNNKLVQQTNSVGIMQPAEFEYIKQLATSIVNSPLADPFKTKDKDGNITVSEGAIIANMVLGHELGLSPVASLTLGKQLNANSYLSVLRGRELGIDSVSSMSKIYHIPTKNGNVIALAVDIIVAKILGSGTSFNYIRDNEPTPMYKSLTGEYIGHKWLIVDDETNKLKDGFYLYQKGVTTKEDLNKAQLRGDTIIYQTGLTNVTSVRFIRKSNNIDMVVHYSLQEAIDAKLYRGFHSTLTENGKPVYVQGKDNWNNHPATHLRHRPLSIGGRIVVADLLMGNYSIDEVIEIIDSDKVQNEEDLKRYQFETATVVNESTSAK